ncbi:MAG TPA: dicarboxylate/amino acid:cation symporter [Gammaproteobacteria bacterium]|jgi:Na+/H+-dicarboxylate symporter|nr:dicarboxylate/amino acid:cation symporter [Gammaproteobacteria bacterium]HBX00406.1 dicarboxylate/amino acid:cation symporter [Gammaproteobacteria bacterium]|tara:strand:+ start:6467 stop:7741 length:1275 start_codon:yes stop_codon:yes gene_type:complete
MSLTQRILIAMGLGLVLGSLLQWIALPEDHFLNAFALNGVIDAGGKIFITLLKMLVVPLVFVSLVCGAASLGDTGSVGRLGGKTIGLYLLTTAIAVSMAMLIALTTDPGLGGESANQAQAATAFEPKTAPSVKDTFINVVPGNPIAAMADGKMLQVILFALLFGLALSRAGTSGQKLRAFFVDLNEVMMRLITMIIVLTPIGVFCLMTQLGATLGLAEIAKVAMYFATIVIALLAHAALVYPLLLKSLTGLSPLAFLAKMREPLLVAFSTSSSGATLPVTLRTVEHKLGVPNNVASFAVPLGATINMDGTAIMQGVATIFIAQFYGIDLGLTALLTVVLTATLASIGTAAVPGVGLITLTLVLDQVGLPVEGIALIIGVDRLLDMLRTAVNVTGDATVATIVASSEDQLDREVFNTPEQQSAVA